MTSKKTRLNLIHSLYELDGHPNHVYLETAWIPSESINVSQPKNLLVPPISKKELLATSMNLESNLLSELTPILNSFHNVGLTERSWKIIIGHWLRAYSRIITKHAMLIEKAINDGEVEISEVILRDLRSTLDPPHDTQSALHEFEQWDFVERVCAVIYGELRGSHTIFEESKQNAKVKNTKASKNDYKPSLFEKAISKGEYLFYKYSKYFLKDENALIVTSYLPFKEELLLNLKLRQWPKFRILSLGIETDQIVNKIESRREIFKFRETDSLELTVARSLLCETFPISFLEGFKNVSSLIQDSNLPKSPKFIFTSNSFMTNEVFKQYTAVQVNQGVKYFVGQHGNNYGTLNDSNPTVEEETSTRFLSWGWESEKATPAFLIKNPSPRTRKSSIELTKLLLVIGTKSPMYSLHDAQLELEHNLSHQANFIASLNPEIQEFLTIRLHPYSLQSGEKTLLQNHIPLRKEQINSGNTSIKPLVKSSRVTVHAYDSTGILETLAANVPTLAFWSHEFSEKTEESQPFYNLLTEIGILHKSGESAAKLVNEIWHDVDSWWLSEKVQSARSEFCYKYARQRSHPISFLLKVFNQEPNAKLVVNSRHD
jgi:putative transferase (TIGR04331 family)